MLIITMFIYYLFVIILQIALIAIIVVKWLCNTLYKYYK